MAGREDLTVEQMEEVSLRLDVAFRVSSATLP
jgi:hypothetical protein